MNRQQFSEFVRNPDSANAQSLKTFEELVKRYPYCQTGQILFTFNLFREGDLQYHQQLKKAAAYAGDRKKLKELIETGKIRSESRLPENPVLPHLDAEVEVMEVQEVTTETTPVIFEAPILQEEPQTITEIPQEPVITIDTLKFQERLSREELLAIVRKRLAEIELEKSDKSAETKIQEITGLPLQPGKTDTIPDKDTSKDELIEKFIREEPKISPPKTAFFNPTDTSHRSNIDDEEIISETLAQLYADQGNIQKAIHIYQKLSLLNQEKSRYFAARIQELGAKQ